MKRRNIIKRFEEKFSVNVQTGCWEWMASLNENGYGQFCIRHGKMMLAHRFSFLLYNNINPKGKFVCHHCDNPICVNPEHLFLGTQLDNMKDCRRKGRNAWTPRYGEDNPASKLTEDDVRQILIWRSQGWTYTRLAEEFPVVKHTLISICKGRAWKHIYHELESEGII